MSARVSSVLTWMCDSNNTHHLHTEQPAESVVVEVMRLLTMSKASRSDGEDLRKRDELAVIWWVRL